jgi:chromosomal replication initiator protein
MYKDGQKVWAEVLSSLKITVSASSFKTWFSGSYLLEYKKTEDRTLLIIGVKNGFLKEQIEKRYLEVIVDILKAKGLGSIEIVLVVSQKENASVVSKSAPLLSGIAQNYILDYPKSSSLNPYHNFSNFIVGGSNNLAYIAATQVAGQLGRVYNPLLFYGPTGVGKTHLLQAIGNEILAKYEDAKVLYVTAERFTNDFLESLRNKNQEAFRNKYRHVHLLIIDDIQFLAGKEGTQDEFFHTFNELYLSGKQIIAASDKHPKELGKLKDRLISRFLGGMCADLSMPDIEMKMAIIKAKCGDRGITLDDEIVNYIARECTGGARELEGMLTTTLAHIKLSGSANSVSDIKSALVKNKKISKSITAGMIMEACCRHFKSKLSDIKSRSRSASLVKTRQVIMYLLRVELELPLESIGDLLGGRDHATVIHGFKKIEKEISLNQTLKDEVLRILDVINS